MKMEMIDGPQGPQRAEDGGGHLVTAGEAISKGDILIADYGNGSGLAGNTEPNTATSAESVYMLLDLGMASHVKAGNALLCVAKEDAAVGEKLRVSYTGYVKASMTVDLTAAQLPVGYNYTTGKVGPGVAGDMILGRSLGAAWTYTDGPVLIWFDGTSTYERIT